MSYSDGNKTNSLNDFVKSIQSSPQVKDVKAKPFLSKLI